MRVLIYEPIYWGGHYLMYVRQLVRTLGEWPLQLVLVTGFGAESSDPFREQIAPYRDRFTHIAQTVPNARRGQDWGRHYFEHLMVAIRAWRPDHVFLPSGDIVAAFAGSRRLRGVVRWSREMPQVDCNVIGSFYKADMPRRGRLRNLRSSLYASYAPWHLYSNDPFLSVREVPWRWLHGSLPEVIPDPFDDPISVAKTDARRMLGLPETGPVVGCVGHFASHERKNPIGLVQGFLQSSLASEGIVALLGQMSPDLVTFIDGLGSDRRRVAAVNRFLTDEEMQIAILALDLVCLPYSNFYHPSAIALHAAILGRPVLASRTGWFEAMIPRFKLGRTADLTTAAAIATALGEGRDLLERFTPSGESRRLAAFLNWRNYGATFGRHLRDRLSSRPTVPAPISWESLVGSPRSTD